MLSILVLMLLFRNKMGLDLHKLMHQIWEFCSLQTEPLTFHPDIFVSQLPLWKADGMKTQILPCLLCNSFCFVPLISVLPHFFVLEWKERSPSLLQVSSSPNFLQPYATNHTARTTHNFYIDAKASQYREHILRATMSKKKWLSSDCPLNTESTHFRFNCQLSLWSTITSVNVQQYHNK